MSLEGTKHTKRTHSRGHLFGGKNINSPSATYFLFCILAEMVLKIICKYKKSNVHIDYFKISFRIHQTKLFF